MSDVLAKWFGALTTMLKIQGYPVFRWVDSLVLRGGGTYCLVSTVAKRQNMESCQNNKNGEFAVAY